MICINHSTFVQVRLALDNGFWKHWRLNTLRPRQNGRRFADDTFKRIFLNENVRISIKISLKFVPVGPINNIPALVLIMAWRRSGDKPLSEPMMVSLSTHICVTRPQWVKRVKTMLMTKWGTKYQQMICMPLISTMHWHQCLIRLIIFVLRDVVLITTIYMISCDVYQDTFVVIIFCIHAIIIFIKFRLETQHVLTYPN